MNLYDVLTQAGLIPRINCLLEVNGISTALCAREDEIAIVRNLQELQKTKARVVLCEKTVLDTDKVVIVPVNSLYEAAVDIARVFIEQGRYSDFNEPEKFFIDSNMTKYGEKCSIGDNSRIGSFTSIGKNCVIGKNVVIEDNVFIGAETIIGDNVVIRQGARIASNPLFWYGDKMFNDYAGIGKVVIENNVIIGTNSIIQRGTFSDTVIGYGTVIGDLVVIGHDTVIGNNCLIVTQTGVSGNVTIGNNVKVYGQSGVKNYVTIEDNAIVLGKTGVWKNVAMNDLISGNYGRNHKDELIFQTRLRRLIEREDL